MFTLSFFIVSENVRRERATRNTLHISAVPILKKEAYLPVVVDVRHSTERCDLLLPNAIMAEVLPDPVHQMNIIVDFCW
ncbi:hypothetical protein BCY92_14795 [Bacillus wiedmannii]|nr:hypothetical protein BCY92_14795 [Bacillus wiedmannii]